MDDVFEQLWQHYLDSCFLLSQPLSSSSPFAIITAYNPLGQVLEPCQNRLRDRALQCDIEQLRVPYRMIIGAAADLSHMEKSWALFVSKTQATALAKKYQQNAFYYVDAGVLSLIPCLAGDRQQVIGDFSQHVRVVSELPEICD
ncbi:DUF3293 domain-containing protein [Shewanella fodinae]|jgi:hypothetical protein|uniref:DUF3293 domain-containing protein n=1 Tax=Shewanella fodinae TaxID=552357 RepID=UPI0016763A10|nr:DUF3293 domain-containing protein [Shewanella fodinae]MCL2907936.1 DUF3293 domain-containing protein [Shewanella fodinae]GGZ11728.1 hypothetical protein GCM10007169_30450 [Shewanella fodinae]